MMSVELASINISIISVCNILSNTVILLSSKLVDRLSLSEKAKEREIVDLYISKHHKYYTTIIAPCLEEINHGMILYCKNKQLKLIFTIISCLSIFFYKSKSSILTAILNISVYLNLMKNNMITKLLYSLLFGVAHGDGSIDGSIYGCMIFSFPNLMNHFINEQCGIPWSIVHHMMNNIICHIKFRT